MIIIDIPGKEKIHVSHLVLDYNGTIAIDGNLLDGVRERLNEISKLVSIHVVTADTFGQVAEQLQNIDCQLTIIQNPFEQIRKAEYINALGPESVIAIGNGANDSLMLTNAALGIAVVQKEGASPKAIHAADIVCNSILDALDLLLHPLRISATTRS